MGNGSRLNEQNLARRGVNDIAILI